jgi:CBS domain-containing protein
VLALVAERGPVHVPVIDEHRKAAGVVNARDALRVLLAQGEYEDSLLRAYVMGVGYH